ncbi:hypothetical protein D3P04_10135 [Paracoccus onubensis]|uniref:Uncharacterized protein n=1 Tax=Paracoccus onubensis TaxID=1675788 RepID=A0A418SWN1_9RHOB|nr:hypothetical protein D3P04_10135 [Paracoccus onubensis]
MIDICYASRRPVRWHVSGAHDHHAGPQDQADLPAILSSGQRWLTSAGCMPQKILSLAIVP